MQHAYLVATSTLLVKLVNPSFGSNSIKTDSDGFKSLKFTFYYFGKVKTGITKKAACRQPYNDIFVC